MFAVPPLLVLLVIDYLKPQEFVPALANLPFLYIFTGLVALGFIVDVRMGRSKLEVAPQLRWAILFTLWTLLTVAIQAPSTLTSRVMTMLIPLSLFVLVAHGVQTFRMLQVVVGLILGIAIFVSALGVQQGLAPWGCHEVRWVHGALKGVYDGRECEEMHPQTCETELAEPGADYLCEHVGLFSTHSDHGRVRYRGALEDPNELSLAIGIAMPFAFAFVDRKRSLARQAILVTTVGLVAVCSIYTQSRGGQLVFIVVIGAYFLRKYGWRGLLVGAVLMTPMLFLGGRDGAEESTIERTECWYEGLRMLRSQPIFGVGSGQFTEHHFLTAHNSYVLAAAEMGLPGLWLFTVIIYISTKIPVQALRIANAPVARTWAMAFIAAMTGMVVGIFFLSYCYKEILWIYFGLCGALYQAVKRHQPSFEVRLTAREGWLIFAGNVALLIALVGYTQWKVG